MNATRLLFACISSLVLALTLGACGVPDIIAHGVKEYDRSQTEAQPAASPQPVSAPAQAPAPAVMHQEPPPSPVVPRDSVTVETLPPPQ